MLTDLLTKFFCRSQKSSRTYRLKESDEPKTQKLCLEPLPAVILELHDLCAILHCQHTVIRLSVSQLYDVDSHHSNFQCIHIGRTLAFSSIFFSHLIDPTCPACRNVHTYAKHTDACLISQSARSNITSASGVAPNATSNQQTGDKPFSHHCKRERRSRPCQPPG